MAKISFSKVEFFVHHYYPFGLVMAGLSSRALASSPENRIHYNGKEEQRQEFTDGSGMEWLDYGARMYDAQVGRWHVIDNFSETYFGVSNYAYGGNSPMNIIEFDGNLFVFANGFMLDQWMKGEGNKHDYRFNPGAINPYTPSVNNYMPDRGFYQSGPINNGAAFENDYWSGVDAAYKNAYHDNNSVYTNGSFTPKASADARFNAGISAGAELIAKLESGEIKLKDGETIKIVGHSQGAAYAAGIATAIARHSKYGSRLEFVDYLSPHQPGDIKHPTGVKGRQFSTKSDKVSSTGIISEIFGSSDYKKIKGTSWGAQRRSYQGGRGGHSVDTWLEFLISYFRNNGVAVDVRGNFAGDEK